jgi:hypothetical protein
VGHRRQICRAPPHYYRLGLPRWPIPHTVSAGSGPSVGTRMAHRCGLHPLRSPTSRHLWPVHHRCFRRHQVLRWWSQPRPNLVSTDPVQSVELAPFVCATSDLTPSSCDLITIGQDPTVCVGTPQLPSPIAPPQSPS